MKPVFWLAGIVVGLLAGTVSAQQTTKVLLEKLHNPESVTIGSDGRAYITEIGAFGKDGDGAIWVLDKKNKAARLCQGLNDPKGIAAYQQWLFVADKDRIVRISLQGKAEDFAVAKDFPRPPLFLNDVVIDPESGILYVSDSGDLKGNGGAIYRLSPQGKVSLVIDKKQWPQLHTPNGLAMDGASHLLVLDFGTGTLSRLRLSDRKLTTLTDGCGRGDGVAWDQHGRLYISDFQKGHILAIPRPGQKLVKLPAQLSSAADLCFDPGRQALLVPDMKAGTLVAVAGTIPGHEVNTKPLPLTTAVAFPNLKWADWQPETPAGLLRPLRPLVLTHAGDGSGRLFVATQRGVIHVFPNDDKAEKTRVFLDIEKKVLYRDDENEQGLLGVAFHPDYKKNGEFFVFYTLRVPQRINVLSRFRVSKDDPDRAEPASEEEIFRIERPFWNHDGGTIVFGPDGYLYVALGDGGSANDPFNNGQNRQTLLGSILRLDIRRQEGGKNYAIPKDNPFVHTPEARPEIWAYGLRNVWRMAFDRHTKKLWAADVGQNLYEEINLITRGGNYGWKLREALHPFGAGGVGVRKDLIDPIWEYHHDVGKSITGGLIYRGKALPELQGAYIYGDYVTGKIWALRYDEKQKRVTANQEIRSRSLPILSFGEDDRGNIYFMTEAVSGRGIYRFVRTAEEK